MGSIAAAYAVTAKYEAEAQIANEQNQAALRQASLEKAELAKRNSIQRESLEVAFNLLTTEPGDTERSLAALEQLRPVFGDRLKFLDEYACRAAYVIDDHIGDGWKDRHIERMSRAFEALAAKLDEDTLAHYYLANSRSTWGSILTAQGRLHEAACQLEQAIAYLRKLKGEKPQTDYNSRLCNATTISAVSYVSGRRSLALALCYLGVKDAVSNHGDEMSRAMEEAIDILENPDPQRPPNLQWELPREYQLACTQYHYGRGLARFGRHTDAIQQFREALKGFLPLAPDFLSDQAMCWFSMAQSYDALGQADEAKQAFRACCKLLEPIVYAMMHGKSYPSEWSGSPGTQLETHLFMPHVFGLTLCLALDRSYRSGDARRLYANLVDGWGELNVTPYHCQLRADAARQLKIDEDFVQEYEATLKPKTSDSS
jgi:tetratricopeptide (TPR) repeat protein